MLRGAAQRSVRLQVRAGRRYLSANDQSMKVPLEKRSAGGGIGKKLFWLFSGSALGTGGVLVYASKDEAVRSVIEGAVPQSKEVIDTVGDYSNVVSEYYNSITSSMATEGSKIAAYPLQALQALPDFFSKKEVTTLSSDAEIPFVELEKVLEENAEVMQKEESVPEVKAEVVHKKELTPEMTVEEPVKPKKDVQEEAQLTNKVAADQKPKQNLDALFARISTEIETAVNESKQFIAAVCAEASNKDHAELSESKDIVRQQRISRIQNQVSEFRDVIKTALEDAKSANQENLLALHNKTEIAVQKLNLATLEADSFKVYAKNYYDNLKKQLSDLKESDIPEDVVLPVKNVEDGNVSTKEVNQFIAFGYRKLKYLEEKLAKHEEAAKESLKAVLEGQRGEVAKVLSQQLEAEFSAKERHLKTEKVAEIVEIEKRLHDIHNDQMARQAHAHNQHLHESLEAQENLLRAKFESSLQEIVSLERSKQQQELISLISRVSAVQQVLTNRGEVDRLSAKSHQLWISAQALHDELYNLSGPQTSVSVKPMLSAINSSYGDDEFVSTLLAQFESSEAVPSQAALANRFDKVKSVCRRVATVPNPPTFTSYIWSYIRSIFILDPLALPIEHDDKGNKCIEKDTDLDNLLILATSKSLLDNNDLELCVKLMNQLSGEPKNVARDWITDARRLLELRQAATAMLAFAAANSAVGFLTYKGLK